MSPPPQDNPLPEDRPHPYLKDPLLYVSNLAPHVSEHDVARALEFCIPFRPNIPRDGSNRPLSGTIEFKELVAAEKALAILNGRPIPFVTPLAYFYLSAFPPTTPPYVPPQAQPRLVKHLPLGYTDVALFELFRPYGPLASVCVNQPGFPEPTAFVEFYSEDDARAAETGLHCTEVMDSTIAVQPYHQPRRPTSEFGINPNAASFVPGYQQYSPPHSQYGGYSPSRASPFMHGPGQQVQFAPLHGPGSNSHSGLIDPCNLFCKNLDPSIDSNELFNQFRRFGQIVSARVMRNEGGHSRGFGFVSFQTPDQAASALQAMNGVVLGSKQIVVRLHEPKQLRQEKLAHRFGSSPSSSHPRNRSGSGATSPTLSEEMYWGRHSPGGPISSTISNTTHTERTRRSSGSYYTAALAGNLNFSMNYDELSALSPVVRKEILSGELSRRVKEQKDVPVAANEIDTIVDGLLSLSLQQIVDGIHDPAKLTEQVQNLKNSINAPPTPPPPSLPQQQERAQPQSQSQSRPQSEQVSEQDIPAPADSPSPSNSQDSTLLDPAALGATASAPEHPSTPLSLSASLSTPPRTSSPSGSIAPQPGSERDRLLAAVSKVEPKLAAEVTDLLMSLSKRDRALCLFNPEVLKGKIAEAKDVLSVVEDEPAPAPASASVPAPAPAVPSAPVTPQSKLSAVASAKLAQHAAASPQTPDLSSSRGPSVVASPTPQTPGVNVEGNAIVYTLSSLAQLSALDIIKLANSPNPTGLPIVKPDHLIVEQTDKFVDGLGEKSLTQQKQLLGEKLFRVVKSFGIKNSPKVTIRLLDEEDLRSLAHLMNSYPAVLREKALHVSSTMPAK